MPVGQMLRQMDARELAEWKAYFLIRKEQAEKPKTTKANEFKALFAHRVVKKKKD
jgi:hypothetical protein